jgi:hypothetical protein
MVPAQLVDVDDAIEVVDRKAHALIVHRVDQALEFRQTSADGWHSMSGPCSGWKK